MNIVILVGSLRKKSYNKALANYIIERYRDRLDLEILPVEKLPFYNQDDELNPPDIVVQLREKIKKADGILIVTPEYNYSVPAVLKNALDWFSRVDKVMIDKPSMILGASIGKFGTVRGQNHLRQILNSSGVGTINMPGNETYINFVEGKVDESGKIIDESIIQILERRMGTFIEWIKLINRN